MNAFGMFDMFNDNMFSGMHGMPRRMSRPKMSDTHIPLSVTLEDLYKGKNLSIPYSKDVICSVCNGVGAKLEALRSCNTCSGRGTQVTMREVLPGISQRVHARCSSCAGEGSIIREKDKCRKCRGKKTLQLRSNLKVDVEKGMSHGEQIFFAGAGDQGTNKEAGDCIVVLKQDEHEHFKRIEDHLVVTIPITLTEALCGLQRTIHHLDGRTLLVQTLKGEVIKPGDIKKIVGEGMPIRNGYLNGDLIIKFELQYPENHFMDEIGYKTIESLLPIRPMQDIPPDDDVEHVDMYNMTKEDLAEAESAQDSDDMSGHGGGVRCAHQ